VTPARWWFVLAGLGGFGFGVVAERRPFGEGFFAHPLVVFFILAALGLLVLRAALARPVPEIIPERALLIGCVTGLAMFLAGNWLGLHFLAVH
jgi:hypothetical protein